MFTDFVAAVLDQVPFTKSITTLGSEPSTWAPWVSMPSVLGMTLATTMGSVSTTLASSYYDTVYVSPGAMAAGTTTIIDEVSTTTWVG